MILIKNPQNWVKIVDFLIIAYFWASPDLPLHDSGTFCRRFSAFHKVGFKNYAENPV